MKYFLLRLTGLILLLCAGMLSTTLVIGHGLLSMTAVFISAPAAGGQIISLVDTARGITHQTYIAEMNSYTVSTGAGCVLPASSSAWAEHGLAYYDVILGREHVYRDTYRGMNGRIDWLPDGRRLWAYVEDPQTQAVQYEIFDTVTGAVVPVDFSDLRVLAAAWSPDSRYGVIYHAGELQTEAYLLDTRTGTFTALENARWPRFDWSSDSRFFASTDLEEHVTVVDAVTLTEYPYEFGALGPYPGVSWSAANQLRFFALTADTPVIDRYIWSPDTRTLQAAPYVISRGELANTPNSNNVWSPDRTKFFYDTGGRVHIREGDTGTELAVFAAKNLDGLFFTWSPNSRYLAGYNYFFDTLVYADSVTGQSGEIILNEDDFTPMPLDPRWLNDTQLEVFQQSTSTLGYIEFTEGRAEFVPVYHVPGSYMAAFCNPEGA